MYGRDTSARVSGRPPARQSREAAPMNSGDGLEYLGTRPVRFCLGSRRPPDLGSGGCKVSMFHVPKQCGTLQCKVSRLYG